MAKIVFFDIDGTLVNSRNELPHSARKAMACLKERGILTGISTGRCPSELREFLSTHKGLEFDYYVYANGALASCESNIIFRQPMPKNELSMLLKRAEENDIPYWTSGDRDWHYSIKDLTPLSDILHNDELKRTDHYNPYYHLNNDVYMGEMLITPDKLNLFSDILKELEIVPAMLVGGIYGPMMDFWDKRINKATGVEQCLKDICIEKEDIIAIGDSFNDIPILNMAGTAIAMGNASEEVKQASNFITKDIDDDGIYYALETLGYI